MQVFAENPNEDLENLVSRRDGRRGIAPPDLEVPGMSSAALRWDREDGWIDVYVAAQAGRWPIEEGQHEAEVPYINS